MRKLFLQFPHLLLLGMLSAAGAGCSLVDKCNCFQSTPKEAPEGHVSGIDMFFRPNVQFVDNTQRPGATVPGLVGRVYLYGGENGTMMPAQGKIVAELYDMTPIASGGSAQRVADWTFEAKALKLVERKDIAGLGYTIFLPLEEYQPSMKKVQIRLAYIDEKGMQHVAAPSTMILRGAEEQAQVNVEHRKALPTDSRVK